MMIMRTALRESKKTFQKYSQLSSATVVFVNCVFHRAPQGPQAGVRW